MHFIVTRTIFFSHILAHCLKMPNETKCKFGYVKIWQSELEE